MRITKSLERILVEVEGSESAFTAADVQQTLSRQVQSVLSSSADPDDLDGMLRTGIYSGISEEEWLLFKFCNPCSGFEMPGANAIAAYRRIRFDAPLEYVLRISLAARVEWMQAKIDWKYNRDDLWRPTLMAAATHDRLALSRLLRHWEERGQEVNNRAYAAICMGLQALATCDPELLETAVEESSKRKTASYIKGVNQVLFAVHSGDAVSFAEGMEHLLKRFKGYMMNDAGNALIDPFAHGLFELAQKYSPPITERFDTARKLPWDNEIREWVASIDDIASELNELEMPGFIRRALIDMDDMDWPPDNRPTV